MDADRIFVNSKGKAYKTPGDDRTEYVRAEPLRAGLTPRLLQLAVQHAQATPRVSAPAVKRVRELVLDRAE